MPTGSWPAYATSLSLSALIASASDLFGRFAPLCAPRSSTSVAHRLGESKRHRVAGRCLSQLDLHPPKLT